MSEIVFLVEESDESGFEAKALEHSIFTEAETLVKLNKMIHDSIKCHFGMAKKFKVARKSSFGNL